MAIIKIAGLDGSLRNFGVAVMTLDTENLALTVENLALMKTEKSKVKSVRSSSDNLARAQSITEGIKVAVKDCAMCFAEVPSGGQSYDAVLGFGIVIGIYSFMPLPVSEVSPAEAKKAAVGTRSASKQEMIDWAFALYPNAPWRLTKRKGAMVPTLDNEHLADAVAVVHAGIKTPAFLQTLAMLRASEKTAA